MLSICDDVRRLLGLFRSGASGVSLSLFTKEWEHNLYCGDFMKHTLRLACISALSFIAMSFSAQAANISDTCAALAQQKGFLKYPEYYTAVQTIDDPNPSWVVLYLLNAKSPGGIVVKDGAVRVWRNYDNSPDLPATLSNNELTSACSYGLTLAGY